MLGGESVDRGARQDQLHHVVLGPCAGAARRAAQPADLAERHAGRFVRTRTRS
jgi:hypothetical protein